MRFCIKKFLLIASLASVSTYGFAQGEISVTINGQQTPFSGTGPQMINGRVLVPLRGIFEKLGASVQWDPAAQRVTATRGGDTVVLQIGSTAATVNGRGVTLDVPAQIVQGSTLVPIRFVSESVGAHVFWHEAEKNVEIQADGDSNANESAPPADAPSDGPIRMARVAYLRGEVSYRPSDDSTWGDAGINVPLREGAQLWVNPGAVAELQFDDGSTVRLNSGSVAILQTLYSDSQGEFTEIRLNSGTASLHLTTGLSTYQVDTPLASVKSNGTSRFRVDADSGLRVAVRQGQATVDADAGHSTIYQGQTLSLAGPTSSLYITNNGGTDSWDRFCDERDGYYSHPSPYLPSTIRIVAGNLDGYGSWSNIPGYGNCWRPNRVDPDWAPYRQGHWVWVDPFGWTWCGNEEWGWAPYHYGTWFNYGGAWYWRPGPSQQYWSPAVVHFSTYQGNIAWVPLAPEEVHYPPTLTVGFSRGNWAVAFSIGGAATYHAAPGGYCEPRPWNNVEINRRTTVYNITKVTNITNIYVSNNGFVPRNARVNGGATVTSTGGFSGGGRFARGNPRSTEIFTKGSTFAEPKAGSHFAGPLNVVPTSSSFSPSRRVGVSAPNLSVLNRRVVRTALPAGVSSVAHQLPNARVVGRPVSVIPSRIPFGSPKLRPVDGIQKGTKGIKGTRNRPGAMPTNTAPTDNAPVVKTRTRRGSQPSTSLPLKQVKPDSAKPFAPKRGQKMVAPEEGTAPAEPTVPKHSRFGQNPAKVPPPTDKTDAKPRPSPRRITPSSKTNRPAGRGAEKKGKDEHKGTKH